jgi:hypothetical protein
MQNVINTVKGTALGVAEYLTPVLKVNIEIYSKFKCPLTLTWLMRLGRDENKMTFLKEKIHSFYVF